MEWIKVDIPEPFACINPVGYQLVPSKLKEKNWFYPLDRNQFVNPFSGEIMKKELFN